jgi:hypothetical protein
MPDDKTPILNLPYILPNQAQKHVTHNEALRLLDVIVQLSVLARNLASPPASPAQGDRYIVAMGASGDWAGQGGKIALYDSGVWQFFAPQAGWRAWIVSEDIETIYTGAAWESNAVDVLNLSQLGIATEADAVNRLAVSSPATLLNHAGNGHQLKINKSAASDTASLLFQTAYSGRAEMGIVGNDDFNIKVSADGAVFVVGLSIAAQSGQVTLPAALRLGGQASDPVSPADGTIWLNTLTGEVKFRSGGTTSVLGGGAQGLADGVRGDITLSGGGLVWTINDGSIGNAKLANMASGTFKARTSGGNGAPEDITPSEATQLLPVFTSTAKGLVPESGGGSSAYLRADGIWATPLGGSSGSFDFNAGTTAPANPTAHMAWMDTTGGLPQLKLRDGANSEWVSFAQGAGYGSIGKNILINAALIAPYVINQRNFNGNWATLINGAYGFDRWYKFDATIRQRVEEGNYKYNTTYTTAYTNATGQRVVALATSPSAGYWELSFPNTATFIQVEEGNQATPFDLRPIGYEMTLCQRYYEMGEATSFASVASGGYFQVSFKVQKRIPPLVKRVSNGLITSSTSGSVPSNTSRDGFYWYRPTTSGIAGGAYTAEAEL